MDFLNDSHVRCLSTHLTTFAVLFDLTGNTVKVAIYTYVVNSMIKLHTYVVMMCLEWLFALQRISKTEIDLLNIFTYIGCGISLICLALTIVILLIFL